MKQNILIILNVPYSLNQVMYTINVNYLIIWLFSNTASFAKNIQHQMKYGRIIQA
jgi:hypothetical protein